MKDGYSPCAKFALEDAADIEATGAVDEEFWPKLDKR